ncbi:GNAT family N-acetyltransferase [Metabacillus sp. Hm71]|uniref:GNAT family N-acetyltransferase n=1 Tax=Metabacillus sp. Hm71 TaxID=3450743 RepID=UPI003F43776A
MKIEIRLSKKSDFERLIEIDRRVWNSKTTPSTITWKSVDEYENRNPEGNQLIALVNGQVVGYLGFHPPTPLKTNQHVMEIDLAVDPEYQGTGIGRKLLENYKQRARKKGISKLSLRVLATNEGAIQFYKKCGFIEQGRLINEFFLDGKFVDDLLMYIQLN